MQQYGLHFNFLCAYFILCLITANSETMINVDVVTILHNITCHVMRVVYLAYHIWMHRHCWGRQTANANLHISADMNRDGYYNHDHDIIAKFPENPSTKADVECLGSTHLSMFTTVNVTVPATAKTAVGMRPQLAGSQIRIPGNIRPRPALCKQHSGSCIVTSQRRPLFPRSAIIILYYANRQQIEHTDNQDKRIKTQYRLWNTKYRTEKWTKLKQAENYYK